MDTEQPRTLLRCITLLVTLVLAGITLIAAPHSGGKQTNRRSGYRLRSFLPNATGTLYYDPSPNGGIVRVTALSLPRAESLAPNAHVYLVWAIAAKEKPLNAGELRIDEAGNGGLEFTRPPNFELYSVVVTAETATSAENPLGVMALASISGAVSTAYGVRRSNLTDSRRKEIERALGLREATEGSRFNLSVDEALHQQDGRTLRLSGNESAPDAYGMARVAAKDTNLYLHAIIRQLPLPSQVGGNTYVLWGIVGSGRITYMGSLPTMYGTETDEYVRVGGFSSPDLDLTVTAETQRPAMHLSGVRAISTESAIVAATGPSYGAAAGVVVNEDGKPIAGARVEVRPTDWPVAPRTTTDEQGRFFLDGIPAGTHVIYASKESAGYPTPYMAFFGVENVERPRVTIDNNEVTESIELHLGPRAGSLAGEVLDAVTRRPVDGVEVTLAREDDPQKYVSFGVDEEGKFQRLIPPMPLTMKVSAPGYQDWYYSESGAEGRPNLIRVAPDSTKIVSILLQRSKTGQ